MVNIDTSMEAAQTEPSSVDVYARLLTQALDDPLHAQAISTLQHQLGEALNNIIDSVALILQPDTQQKSRSPGELSRIDIGALVNSSRHRMFDTQQRRELAEMLVIDALIHRDSPQWHTGNHADQEGNQNNALLALFKIRIPE